MPSVESLLKDSVIACNAGSSVRFTPSITTYKLDGKMQIGHLLLGECVDMLVGAESHDHTKNIQLVPNESISSPHLFWYDGLAKIPHEFCSSEKNTFRGEKVYIFFRDYINTKNPYNVHPRLARKLGSISRTGSVAKSPCIPCQYDGNSHRSDTKQLRYPWEISVEASIRRMPGVELKQVFHRNKKMLNYFLGSPKKRQWKYKWGTKS